MTRHEHAAHAALLAARAHHPFNTYGDAAAASLAAYRARRATPPGVLRRAIAAAAAIFTAGVRRAR